MNQPLCILVTRPDLGGVELCQQIQSQGDVAIHLPTIAFAPPPNPQAFENGLEQLGEQDWLLFVSPQSVRASIPSIRRAWPNLPATVHFAAIGAGTAQALKAAGHKVACVPNKEWSSEGLLDTPEFQQLQNKRVAIIRGEGGREILEEILAERGATVLSLIAYQRVIPSVDMSSCLPLLKDGKIDVIVCTSYEGVANLKQMVGGQSWPALKQTPLMVVSDRIKALAQDAGFQTIWVASNASQPAILKVIAEKRNQLCQNRPMKG